MRLKLFRAPGMAEAMAQVRAELGAEALILNTRRVADGVEITAALSPPLELPASFGEDANGELYVVMIGGNVYRIVPG